MAFKRIVRLDVGEAGEGLRISGLNLDFSIEKSRSAAQNTAKFTIYNAQESTRNKILKKGNNLVFSLGYEDETVGTVFIGNIDTSYSYHNGVDWVTEIKAYTIQAKNQKLETIPINYSYTAGTPIVRAINQISVVSGLVVNGLTNAAAITLPNGWVYTGTLMGALRYIRGVLEFNELSFFIDNSEIVIYKKGEASIFKTVLLTYTGGLQSIENITKAEEDEKRVKFTSLIIPSCRVGSVVTARNTPQDGTYIVDKINLDGNNYGGDFRLEGEAVK